MKILVLVDIDGTLNAVCNPANPPKIQSHWFSDWKNFTIDRRVTPEFFNNSHERVKTFTVNFSVELLDNLSAISKKFSNPGSLCDMSFKWLTTWKDFAHSIFCKEANFTEGLNWDVIHSEIRHKPWWKFTIIKEILENDEELHIILLDDEVDSEENLDLFEKLIENTNRLTVINPNSSIGLTRAEISFLESMLANPQPGVLSL